ncbi:hypothetical protein PTTG_27114 [Puccinia triticina 1-1 BBBD Race 1]|uniref:Uncharacterized protein n=2 Tax=Puccinia triticina TaxID=208348 RepID=A0A180GNE5_PUCT1|nr:uncharacterized protein PtA15_2A61 [Puccinia triticina]OAV93988.1 hypothetical protein PTTG_27114 [Puccinia triticina 1-1 BBBD Race 1]WAQ81750.1 hypothetical protein PtA15_2A61 [Puccinia triticina]WAR52639.1 hypothetical protein PtB15_2B63 [Puccinia triticina]
MARTRKFFRLKNSSKDSGLSFHCCGKPDDLLDEPLDFANAKRLPRGQVGLTNSEPKISERHFDSMLVATLCNEHRLMKERRSSEAITSDSGPSGSWPLQSLLFRSTASSPNLKRRSRVQRTKLWAKKYIDPHINDKALAHEEMKCSTRQDVVKPQADAASEENLHPKLRSARSMPLLNDPGLSTMPPSHRRRSKCLSSFSFSGLDALVGLNCDQTKNTSQKKMQRLPISDPYPLDNATTRTGSAQSTSSKLHTSIFSKNSKFSSLLSSVSWHSIIPHRQEKDG